ncbi:hypothetical protein OROHE_025568 [Orobanche hederae]
MADDQAPPPIRLMNFVKYLAQEKHKENERFQLKEARRTRGARVDDGTAQRDRPLYEILKETKDKKDAEFNERFKHRPPKALDEDETEFLDKLERARREHERQMADEEEQQLRSFQAAVASQSTVVHELKETLSVPQKQDKSSIVERRNRPCRRPVGMVIKVKPQAKKAKMEGAGIGMGWDTKEPVEAIRSVDRGSVEIHNVDASCCIANISGLVSYSDESEDDE